MSGGTRDVVVDEIVGVAPDALWRTIAGGGDVHVWFPDVIRHSTVEGRGVGATRRCTMTSGASLVERVLEVDDAARRFVYAIDEHPLPASDVVATLRIEDVGEGRSRVHWGAVFTPEDGADEEVVAMLRQTYARGIANLAEHHGASLVREEVSMEPR